MSFLCPGIDESTLTELPKLGRGRPSDEVRAELARLEKVIAGNLKRMTAAQTSQSDSEVLDDIRYRFSALSRYAIASAMGEIRSLIASGSPGIGKTFDLIKTLDETIPGEYEVIEGGDISPVHLFMAGYRNRHPGRVLIWDDADGVFSNETCLNLVKKLTDSTAKRRVTYMKASPVLAENDVPNEYEFEGSVIFISNLDLERVGSGTDKRASHIQALLTRSLLLDLRIHDIRSKYVWVRQRALEAVMPSANATQREVELVLNFLDANYERFKALSLRSIGYLLMMIRSNPLEWQRDAHIMLLKN